MSTPVPLSTTQQALDCLKDCATALTYLADNHGGAWTTEELEKAVALAEKAEDLVARWYEIEASTLQDMADLHAAEVKQDLEATERHLLQNDEAREDGDA